MDARTRRKLGRFIFCTPFAAHDVLFRCFVGLSVDDARITEVRDLSASCSQFRLRVGSSYWYRKDGSYVES
jgi:hypothetical protein